MNCQSATTTLIVTCVCYFMDWGVILNFKFGCSVLSCAPLLMYLVWLYTFPSTVIVCPTLISFTWSLLTCLSFYTSAYFPLCWSACQVFLECLSSCLFLYFVFSLLFLSTIHWFWISHFSVCGLMISLLPSSKPSVLFLGLLLLLLLLLLLC